MEDSRYLQCLAADYGDLRDAASAAELTANVPSCPGWTVADLVRHVAQVYLHKVTLMSTGEEPLQWPPPSLAAEAPLAALGRAYGALPGTGHRAGGAGMSGSWLAERLAPAAGQEDRGACDGGQQACEPGRPAVGGHAPSTQPRAGWLLTG